MSELAGTKEPDRIKEKCAPPAQLRAGCSHRVPHTHAHTHKHTLTCVCGAVDDTRAAVLVVAPCSVDTTRARLSCTRRRWMRLRRARPGGSRRPRPSEPPCASRHVPCVPRATDSANPPAPAHHDAAHARAARTSYRRHSALAAAQRETAEEEAAPTPWETAGTQRAAALGPLHRCTDAGTLLPSRPPVCVCRRWARERSSS